ncbi:hypothetical protein ACFQ1S_37835, partial [Kibdelosporangium lantanae]
YMADDNDRRRFFAYLNLFVAAMLILVLGNSFVTLYLGWEGGGTCSASSPWSSRSCTASSCS